MRTEVERLPEVFLDRLKYIFPPKKYHQLVNTFAFKKPVSFRINTAKISLWQAKEELIKNKIHPKGITWYNEAYYTDEAIQRLQKLSLYTDGKIYLQRLSSMIPPLILKPKKTDIVLDMAASPGSKTLQMANIMQNQGLIIACEKDEIRVQTLMYNLKKQGVLNTRVRMVDSTKIWQEYKEYFDKILLDAPCSSEARFYIYNPNTYKHWTEKFIKKMSYLQKKLIASALVCLKVGGELVYSTCTFAPEENEEIIDWVIQMAGDRLEILNPNLKISNVTEPILRWQGKSFAKKVLNCRRVFPNRDMEGMFVAKIRKVGKITV